MNSHLTQFILSKLLNQNTSSSLIVSILSGNCQCDRFKNYENNYFEDGKFAIPVAVLRNALAGPVHQDELVDRPASRPLVALLDVQLALNAPRCHT